MSGVGGVGAVAANLLAAWRMPSSFDAASLSPIVECIGWTLVHFTWEGLAVAALLWMTLRTMREHSAGARYGVSCLAMALLVALPGMTFFFVAATPVTWVDTDELTRRALLAAEAERVDSAADASPLITTAPQPHHYPLLPPLERLRALFPWLVGTWAAGVALLAVWHSIGWMRVRRLCRIDITPMGALWDASLREVAQRLGVRRAVRLMESTRASVPIVVGWLRPMILMPAAAVSGLSVAHLEAILAHELAHVRRLDYLVNLIQVAAETLLFYHPAVWWVSSRIRIEREHCCDDLAAAATPGGAVAYARALAKLEELRMPTLPHNPLRLVPAATTGSLLSRVRRLLGTPEETRNTAEFTTPRSRPIAAAVLVAAAIAAGAIAPFAGLPGAVAADTNTPAPAADAPKERTLQPEDVIRVSVIDPDKPDAAKKLTTARVDEKGNIRLPYIGQMKVAGLTVAKLEDSIKRAYGPEGVNILPPVPNGQYKVSYAPPGEAPDPEPADGAKKAEIRVDGLQLNDVKSELTSQQTLIDNVNTQLKADLVRVQAQGDVTVETQDGQDVQQAVVSRVDAVPDNELRLEVHPEIVSADAVDVRLDPVDGKILAFKIESDDVSNNGKANRTRLDKPSSDARPEPAEDSPDQPNDPNDSADGNKPKPPFYNVPYVARLFNKDDGKPMTVDKADRDAKMQVVRKQLEENEVQLSELRKTLGEQHPKVMSLQLQQDRLKQALAEPSPDGGNKNNRTAFQYKFNSRSADSATAQQNGNKAQADAKAQYEISVAKANADMNLQKQKLTRLKVLTDQGAASQGELDRAKAELQKAQADLERARTDFERRQQDAQRDRFSGSNNNNGDNDHKKKANNKNFNRTPEALDGRDQADFERDLARRKLEVLNEELARSEVEQAKAHAMAAQQAQQADRDRAEAQLKALEAERAQLRSAYEQQQKVTAEMEKRRAEMGRERDEMMKKLEAERRAVAADQAAKARDVEERARRAQAEAERARADALAKEADARTHAQQEASGEYFIGGVPQPGSRPVRTGGKPITLLQALVAGGFDPAKSKEAVVVLVRQPSDPNSAVQRESISVDDVIEGKQRPLQSGDVILVRPAGGGGDHKPDEPARR